MSGASQKMDESSSANMPCEGRVPEKLFPHCVMLTPCADRTAGLVDQPAGLAD
jgi:hypothetical protein